jgi:hypothetical protein
LCGSIVEQDDDLLEQLCARLCRVFLKPLVRLNRECSDDSQNQTSLEIPEASGTYTLNYVSTYNDQERSNFVLQIFTYLIVSLVYGVVAIFPWVL